MAASFGRTVSDCTFDGANGVRMAFFKVSFGAEEWSNRLFAYESRPKHFQFYISFSWVCMHLGILVGPDLHTSREFPTLPPGLLFQDDSSFYPRQRSARRTDGSTEKWRTNLPREAIPLFCRDGDSLQGMNSYCWVDSIFEFGEKWSVHFWSPRNWKRCPFYAQTAIRDLNFGLYCCITALRLSILIFAAVPLCVVPRSVPSFHVPYSLHKGFQIVETPRASFPFFSRKEFLLQNNTIEYEFGMCNEVNCTSSAEWNVVKSVFSPSLRDNRTNLELPEEPRMPTH